MAFRFTLKLNGKDQKVSVYNLTVQSFMLTMRNLFYRCFKTDDFDLPYVTEEDVAEMKKIGFYDMIGAAVNGERLDMITVKVQETTKAKE